MKEAYVEPPKFDIEKVIEEGDYVTAMGSINLRDKNGKMVSYSYCDV